MSACPPRHAGPGMPGPARDELQVEAERRGVTLFQHLAVADVHVDATRQAWVEAAHRPHDVDALEVVRPVLLEDRSALDGILVRTGGAVDVAWVSVPGGGRIRVVVGDLALADHEMVREHAAHRL